MNASSKVGLTIFDIDETLFHTKAKVQVSKEGKIVKILDNQQYNSYRLKKRRVIQLWAIQVSQNF